MLGHAITLFRTPLKPNSQPLLRGLPAILFVIAGLILCHGAAAQASAEHSDKRAAAKIAGISLSFEANQGQTDRQVKFLSRGDRYALFLTSNKAVLELMAPEGDRARSSVIRMEMLGAASGAQARGTDLQPGVVNYFIGNDPKRWHSEIQTYAKVKYQGIYPGVDVVFYGNQRQFEYDFVVASGADPDQIALGLNGVQPVLDADGNVALKTTAGDLLLRKPVVYQGAGDSRKVIAANYTLSGNTVRFHLGKYDRSQPLVIDPKFDYMCYLGGSGTDFVGAGTSPYGGISPTTLLLSNALAVDSSGNTYVTGQTYSADFPTHDGYEDAWAGYSSRNQAAYVSKINAAGTAFVYSTYLAGSDPNTDSDNGAAIAVDASGDVYVVGWTQSPDFPVTKSAYQTTVGNLSAFLTKLNPSGTGLVYSTVLGGASPSYSAAYGIAVDSKGQAYVVGNVSSNDAFPFTSNALLKTANGNAGSGFVSVFNAAGSSLLYSSLIGDANAAQFNTTAQGIAVDPSGNFYVTGSTESPNMPVTAGAFQTTFATPNTSTVAGFAAKFGPVGGSGNLLTYLTYLHATTIGDNDWGAAIVADNSGDAYIAGYTQSSTFPTTTDAYQTACPTNCAFVTKLNPSGTKLVWSTLLGGDNPNPGINGTGSVDSYVSSIALDALGNVYVAGAAGDGFPTVNSVESGSFVSGGFISKLNSTGSSLLFSSLIGDQGVNNWISGAAVDPLGNISAGGVVQGVAAGLPVTSGAPQTTFGGGEYDGFVAKIHLETPDLTIAKTHTGNFTQGENAAGYTITVSNIGDGPTSGTVTVTEAIPSGLTLESMGGTGWTCTTLPACTRSDALAAGASYPPITVGVNVASNAPASVTNVATVAGGSEYNTSNDFASDATTITAPLLVPTVTVKPSSSNIAAGQSFTVAVTVTGSGATPTGTVKLSSGGYTSSSATLAGGSYTFTIPANSLSGGTDTLSVGYSGDTNYAPATGTATVKVTAPILTPTVKVTPAATTLETTASLNVTVSVTGSGATPTGTVKLSGGEYTSATATLTSGSYTFSIPANSLSVGTDSLTVSYSGDTNYASATGTASVTVALPLTPKVSVTPSVTTLVAASSLSVAGTVTGSGATPTGTVKLSGGGYTSPSVTLSSGTYSFTVPANSLSAGTDTLTVSYNGDSNYNAATGIASVNVSATPLTPTVTVTPASANLDSSSSLSVTTAVSGAGVTPTGTVTLSGGGYTSSSQTLVNGSYTFTIPSNSLSSGSDTLTVSYSGDSNYIAGTGTASVTVTQSVFTLAATNPAAVAAGTSATSTVTISTATGYAGTVSLSCALTSSPTTATDLPTCSSGSSTIGLNSSVASGMATLTVSSTSSTSALARPGSTHTWAGASGAVLALVALLGMPARRRNWRSMLGVLVLIGALGSLVACGGKGSKSGTGNSGTTAGTYTFTVSGTGSPSVNPTPTTTFTVTIN